MLIYLFIMHLSIITRVGRAFKNFLTSEYKYFLGETLQGIFYILNFFLQGRRGSEFASTSTGPWREAPPPPRGEGGGGRGATAGRAGGGATTRAPTPLFPGMQIRCFGFSKI